MNKQENYSAEYIERTDVQAILVKMSAIEPFSPAVRVAIENAYRRGFFQGAFAALERPYPPEIQEAWLNRIYDWRYKKHNGKFEEPEWLARGRALTQ